MINLDNWGDDFERGDVNEYSVEAMDVGEVLMIHLHNNGGGWWYKNPDWFVNRISVISFSQQNPFEFPCYRWVLSDWLYLKEKVTRPWFYQNIDIYQYKVVMRDWRRSRPSPPLWTFYTFST